MDVPVKDMEAWVNRSVDVRLKEVEDRKGYVTRPMNSFMLYRSAYAERLKQWGVHNNHQVVSSMAGESWPLEPSEIREHYNDLAKLERTNHQNAHPNYKFSPSKTVSPKKRKGGEYESDEEEDLTDLDDPDAEWGAGRRQRVRRDRQPEDFPLGLHSPYQQHAVPTTTSVWEASDGGKPLPQAIGGHYIDHRYYQPTPLPQYAMPTMEEIRGLRQMEHQGLLCVAPMHQSLVGLPGGQHGDLLQTAQHAPTMTSSCEVQFDPSLMDYYTNGIDGLGASYEDGAQVCRIAPDFLGTGQEEWHVDPSLQPLGGGSGFEQWMDDEIHHH